MVQRGIPWDELPHNYKLKYSPQLQPVQQKEIHSASSNREAGSMQDSTEKRTSDNVDVDPKAPKLELLSWDGMESVARRFAFGTLCGGITGASFGVVDILRDPKNLAGKAAASSAKVFRFTYQFSGFFAAYHTTRQILKLTVGQPLEQNIPIAAGMCIAPLIVMGSLRPMIPYSVMLVAMDAFNEYNDIKK